MTALQYGASEGGTRVLVVARQERINTPSTSRLSKDSDLIETAAKRMDIALHPVERQPLIENPKIIVCNVKLSGVGEAEDVWCGS